MAVLESKLIIGASDETGAAFASVMARITEMSAKLASVNGALGGALPRGRYPKFCCVSGRLDSFPRALESACSGRFLGDCRVDPRHPSRRQSGHGQHERMRQDLATMSAEEIAKSEKLAADLAAKYPSTPQSEVMRSLRTARTVTGSFDEATDVLEPLTKLRVIAQAASPGTSAEDMRGEFDKLVKALEVAGVTQDKPRLNSYINDVAKIAQRLRGSDQARRLF
jgi:hypothetical protein